MSERKNHINSNKITYSVIIDHRLEFSHEFDWKNVQILNRERFLSKCLISEMIHVKRQKNSLNLQSDTESLDNGVIIIIYYIHIFVLFSYFCNAHFHTDHSSLLFNLCVVSNNIVYYNKL